MAIQTRIAELEAELAKLKAEVDNTWPKYEDVYFCVDETSETGVEDYTLVGDEVDRKYQSTGNMFRAKEEALQEFEHRKTIAAFRSQPGRKVFVFGEKNWCMSVHSSNRIVNGYFSDELAGLFQTYFNSQESVENAIKAVGEEKIIAAVEWYAKRV